MFFIFILLSLFFGQNNNIYLPGQDNIQEDASQRALRSRMEYYDNSIALIEQRKEQLKLELLNNSNQFLNEIIYNQRAADRAIRIEVFQENIQSIDASILKEFNSKLRQVSSDLEYTILRHFNFKINNTYYEDPFNVFSSLNELYSSIFEDQVYSKHIKELNDSLYIKAILANHGIERSENINYLNSGLLHIDFSKKIQKSWLDILYMRLNNLAYIQGTDTSEILLAILNEVTVRVLSSPTLLGIAGIDSKKHTKLEDFQYYIVNLLARRADLAILFLLNESFTKDAAFYQNKTKVFVKNYLNQNYNNSILEDIRLASRNNDFILEILASSIIFVSPNKAINLFKLSNYKSFSNNVFAKVGSSPNTLNFTSMPAVLFQPSGHASAISFANNVAVNVNNLNQILTITANAAKTLAFSIELLDSYTLPEHELNNYLLDIKNYIQGILLKENLIYKLENFTNYNRVDLNNLTYSILLNDSNKLNLLIQANLIEGINTNIYVELVLRNTIAAINNIYIAHNSSDFNKALKDIMNTATAGNRALVQENLSTEAINLSTYFKVNDLDIFNTLRNSAIPVQNINEIINSYRLKKDFSFTDFSNNNLAYSNVKFNNNTLTINNYLNADGNLINIETNYTNAVDGLYKEFKMTMSIDGIPYTINLTNELEIAKILQLLSTVRNYCS